MENKICEACNKEFQYELKPGFPRKYCPNCSAEKKAAYENKPSPENQQIDARNDAVANSPKLMDARTESIVAQVILKEAANLTCTSIASVAAGGGDVTITAEDIGKILCEAVNELTGAFKLALSNVQAL